MISTLAYILCGFMTDNIVLMATLGLIYIPEMLIMCKFRMLNKKTNEMIEKHKETEKKKEALRLEYEEKKKEL